MRLKPNPLDLASFSALTLLVRSFDPKKPVPDMTYNVFGGTLSLTQSVFELNVDESLCSIVVDHLQSSRVYYSTT